MKHEKLNYRDKWILAPMVRVGVLPFRLECLKYGADLVFTEELIDKRVYESVRYENKDTGAVEYISTRDKSLTFSTNKSEAGKLIFQLGTCDGISALKAALTVLPDITAIDINMGCPKSFSVNNGMGAALLSKPELASDIIKTLKRNLPCSVSCKIRLLDDSPFQKSLDFANLCIKSGVDALTLHSRERNDRPRVKAKWYSFEKIKEGLRDAKSVAFIGNGDFYTAADINSFSSHFDGVLDSFLIARGALYDPSMFLLRKEWKKEKENQETNGKSTLIPSRNEVLGSIVRECIQQNTNFQNTKFIIQQMVNHENGGNHTYPFHYTREFLQSIHSSKSMLDLCRIFGLEKWFFGDKLALFKNEQEYFASLTAEASQGNEEGLRLEEKEQAKWENEENVVKTWEPTEGGFVEKLPRHGLSLQYHKGIFQESWMSTYEDQQQQITTQLDEALLQKKRTCEMEEGNAVKKNNCNIE